MQDPVTKRKINRLFNSLKRLAAFIILGALLAVFTISLVRLGQLSRSTGITPAFIIKLIFSSDSSLKKHDGRTNILLLGMAGGNHAGSDLTDTIIVASIDFSKQKIFLLSLPRDIWVPSMRDKINSAYHYGYERSGEDGGNILAKAAAEEVVGLPIHYIWRIDFDGFTKLVDLTGGVELEVEEGFVDGRYPIEGREDDLCDNDPEFLCRYETVRFEKGTQIMDGEQALKYVRSRNAEGTQGTDIARGRRQQQVIVALVKKATSFLSLLDIRKSKALVETAQKAVGTDMKINEMLFVAKAFLRAKGDGMVSIDLPIEDIEKEKQGILFHPPLWQYDNRWVLIPQGENFTLLHDYIICRMEKDSDCKSLYEEDVF